MPLPSLEDLADPGIKPGSPALQTELPLSGIKNSPANAGDVGSILGSGRPPEMETATHSSILAWEIPWTEEPSRLQFMRPQS